MIKKNTKEEDKKYNFFDQGGFFGGYPMPFSYPIGGALDYNFAVDRQILNNMKQQNKGNELAKPMYTYGSTLYKDGGGIHIKHPGRLTALKKRTGKTEAELWAEGRPEVRKMITFARNSRKWKHADGGYMEEPDNTRVERPVFFPIERQQGFTPSEYFWESGAQYPAGLWQHDDGTFHTTKIENGEDIVLTKEEADSIIRANRAKNRKERLRKIVENKNTFLDLQQDAPLFALGGDLQSHGADWSDGLTHIDAGGSHEANPYDGVQMGVDPEGVPNLVEENETVWNDYVFSARIEADDETKKRFHLPKKVKLTYADISKRLEKEIKERPNDPISKASFKAQMEDLVEQQERQKQEMEAARAREAFEALSPEEQTALMQQKAEQEQMSQEAAQQQAMQEQAMAEQQAMQQLTPEEMAMAQQQAAEQTMPMEGQMAYGGNLYAGGGALEWLNKNHPSLKHKEEIAKIMESRASRNKNGNYYYSDISMFGGNNAPYTHWDKVFTSLKPASAGSKEHYDALVADGASKDVAFELAWSEDSLKSYAGANLAAAKKKRDDAYKAWTREPVKTRKVQWRSVDPNDTKIYATEREAREASAKYNLAQRDARKAAAAKAGQPQSTQAPASVQETASQSTQPPVNAKVQNAEKPTVQSRRTPAPVARKSTPASQTLHPGKWSEEGDHWGTFTKPGLNAFIDDWKARIDAAPTDEAKNSLRRQAMQQFNEIQQGYANIYPDEMADAYAYSKDVWNHQDRFNKAHGNTGFAKETDEGGIENLVAGAIDIPNGAASGDRPTGNWTDGYWGPRTSIRNFGSTEYGDAAYYNDLASRFGELGLTYAPNAAWKYKNGDKEYSLYGLSIPEVASVPETPEEEPEAAWDYGDYTPQAVEVLEDAGTDDFVEVDENGNPKGDRRVVPVLKDESLRYAGLFGPAVGLGLMAAGVGKPDTSGIDAAVASANQPAHLANYKPIGDYLTYRPLDTWFAQNRMDASARAADRTIMNSSLPTATKYAALLANNYNNTLSSGNLFRQAQEYNDALRKQVADFNRGTNQFNAEAYNRNSQFNADALNRGRQYSAQLALQGAAQKMAADAGWYNSLYGNIGGLFRGLSDLGRENADRNWVARLAASGALPGIVPENAINAGLVEYADEAAKKKKKKRGLLNV